MNAWAISGAFFSLSYLISIWIFVFKGYSILKDIKTYLKESGQNIDATYRAVKSEPETEATLYTKVKELVWKSSKHVEKTDSLIIESALVTSRVESLHSRYNDERTNILYGFEKLIVEIKDYLKAAVKK